MLCHTDCQSRMSGCPKNRGIHTYIPFIALTASETHRNAPRGKIQDLIPSKDLYVEVSPWEDVMMSRLCTGEAVLMGLVCKRTGEAVLMGLV